MKIVVAGCGMGAENLLLPAAKHEIQRADYVFGAQRLLECFSHFIGNGESVPVCALEERIRSCGPGSRIAVLASGDVGFFSISKMIREAFPEEEITFINGISSLQYFCAKLGKEYDDVKVVSAHGRQNRVLPAVCYHKKVFALTGGQTKIQDITNELCASGLGDVLVSIGENLGEKTERIITGKAKELKMEFGNLAVMLVENPGAADFFRTLKDEEFTRGKTPMTKQEIRDIVLAELEIRPTDTVYDVGAGTGSVSVAMAMKARESRVFAIERHEEARSLIRKNIEKFGTYNVEIISGTAPKALEELPAADKVFIGGSGGNMESIVRLILEKNPQAIFVAAAVAIESVGAVKECFERLGILKNIVCVNVSEGTKKGNYTLMTAKNPVFLIKGEGVC